MEGEGITPGFICKYKGEETYTDMSLWDHRKCLNAEAHFAKKTAWSLDIQISASEKRQNRKLYSAYKPYTQHTSHTGIIRTTLGYCFLLLLFWQYANSFCDLDISVYVIRIWQEVFRQISLGKTSLPSPSLGLTGDKSG